MRKKCIFSFFFKLVKLFFKIKNIFRDTYLRLRKILLFPSIQELCQLSSKLWEVCWKNEVSGGICTKHALGTAYKQAILCHHNTEVSPDAATQQHQRWSSYLIRPLTLNLLLHINIKHSQTRLYFLASFEVKDSRHGLKRLMAQGRLNEVI